MFLAFYVYLLLLLVMVYFGYQYSKTNKNAYAYIVIGVFTFVIGLRYGVGDDYLAYMNYYFKPELFPKMEWGYTYINKIFRELDFHYCTIFLLGAFLEIYFFTRAFKNFKFILPLAYLFLFTTLELFIWDNTVRQSLAFCVFLCSIQYVQEKKLIPFVILILIGAAFHKTAYPLLAFYFVLRFHAKDDRWFQYMMLLGTFAAGAVLKVFLLTYMTKIALMVGIGGSAGNAEFLQSVDWSNGKNSLGLATLIWLAIDMFCVWLYPALKKKYKEVGFEKYYFLYFCGILMQNCVGGTYLDRVNMYFLPFRIVIYSFCVYEMAKKRNVFYKIPIMMFCGLTFALFLWAISKKAGTCAPYEFVELGFFPDIFD